MYHEAGKVRGGVEVISPRPGLIFREGISLCVVAGSGELCYAFVSRNEESDRLMSDVVERGRDILGPASLCSFVEFLVEGMAGSAASYFSIRKSNAVRVLEGHHLDSTSLTH